LRWFICIKRERHCPIWYSVQDRSSLTYHQRKNWLQLHFCIQTYLSFRLQKFRKSTVLSLGACPLSHATVFLDEPNKTTRMWTTRRCKRDCRPAPRPRSSTIVERGRQGHNNPLPSGNRYTDGAAWHKKQTIQTFSGLGRGQTWYCSVGHIT
jgi:hypothetical protein